MGIFYEDAENLPKVLGSFKNCLGVCMELTKCWVETKSGRVS